MKIIWRQGKEKSTYSTLEAEILWGRKPGEQWENMKGKLRNRQNGIKKLSLNFKHVNSQQELADWCTEKAQKFYEFFSGVYTREYLDGILEVTSQEPTVHQDLSSVEIDETEVMDLLKRLQKDKSPGPDGSHPRVLKECATEMAHPLTVSFWSSLREKRLLRNGAGVAQPFWKCGVHFRRLFAKKKFFYPTLLKMCDYNQKVWGTTVQRW